MDEDVYNALDDLEVTRKRKRLRIIAVSVVLGGIIIAGVIFLVYSFFIKQPLPPEPPSPVVIDEEGEEVVDPELESIQVQQADFFQLLPASVDLFAVIENPNENWGAGSVFYHFILYDSGGAELKQVGGVSFILPKQEKTIVVPAVAVPSRVGKVSFSIERVDWQELQDFILLDIGVRDIRYTNLPGTSGFFAKASAIVGNESLFGITNIDANALLFDSVGRIIAVNRSDMQTMQPGQERLVEFFWPHRIPRSVARVDIRVDSNVLLDVNFLKEYGTLKKFQEYYNVTDVSKSRPFF